MNNMLSPWDYDAPKFQELNCNIEVDACVIGGGIAGMSVAYKLAKSGLKVAVLEANRIGRGQTLNSSAMLSYAQDLFYSSLIVRKGLKYAKRYLDATVKAIDDIERVIIKEGMDCSFKRCDSYIYTDTKKGISKLRSEQKAYEMLGVKAKLVGSANLPFPVMGALKTFNHAVFNPYKFVHGLANCILNLNGQIFEGCRVKTAPREESLEVDGFKVKAKSFIVATHYPFINLRGFFFIKMYQHTSHNLWFSSSVPITAIYESVEEQGLELRGVGEFDSIAGGANVHSGKAHRKSHFDEVKKRLDSCFKDANVRSYFSAQDCMTFDNLPYVGEYGLSAKNLYVVTGFNKWGMASSFISADIISGLISGQKIDNLFDTGRVLGVGSVVKASEHVTSIVGGFSKAVMTSAKRVVRLERGQFSVYKHRGHRIGVYRDDSGKLHAIKAICPHMGCGLNWNLDEKSWDCPCHGSRFSYEGKLLSSPSVYDLEYVDIHKEETKGI